MNLPLCEVTEPSQRVEWTDAANGTFYSQSQRQEVGRNPNALKIVGPKSEYVTYAMIGGEKCPRHESEKITALKDGLDGHDRQRGVKKVKPASERKDDRNKEQQGEDRQKDFESENRTDRKPQYG
jgi:hypothetical protein